ncbi:hypothetical protein D1815_02420 [Aquimarina sp. AD1]|uniref:hypothetical protein n=1 Tax=Aquimarina sp. (strain AD1) TaxID=1714848 RepID=UPI000E4C4E5C|nr:hypothetical protein [Aquimarina sp. AD1]AXT54661.1 hypothetical protein D1815_02420 [Aquimarina sp. AD1]RKN01076.1 hypothetical protein D7035_23385 [Aquimarina sp. AD1]
MNKILISLVFILFLSNIYSQDDYLKLPRTKTNCPTIIIEKDIIANESAIGTTKELITEISVLKDKPNRKEHKFFNLTENGIIFFSLKKKIPFKKQSELNDFFGIEKNSGVYVNGYLLESSDYKIATESILEVELVEPNSENKLKNKAINIWTLTKEERTNGCKKQNVN